MPGATPKLKKSERESNWKPRSDSLSRYNTPIGTGEIMNTNYCKIKLSFNSKSYRA